MLARVHGTAEVIAEQVAHDECRGHARQDSCSNSHDWTPLVRSAEAMESRRESPSAAERSNSPGAGEQHASNNLTNEFDKHAVPRSGGMSLLGSGYRRGRLAI